MLFIFQHPQHPITSLCPEHYFTMRDRLEEMHRKAQEFSDAASTNTVLGEDDDEFVVLGIITPEAVLFEEEPIIENILSDTQLIRDDITALETEVQINKIV